ncbi:hypothetical protein [Amycolatopsis sp. NPDC051128]|uniref:hypothetical protein n=1 Tax=Amycolatopsis sp. NPDC051128 TaxID=3155412 RepID=UPI003429186A
MDETQPSLMLTNLTELAQQVVNTARSLWSLHQLDRVWFIEHIAMGLRGQQ